MEQSVTISKSPITWTIEGKCMGLGFRVLMVLRDMSWIRLLREVLSHMGAPLFRSTPFSLRFYVESTYNYTYGMYHASERNKLSISEETTLM